MCKSCGVRELQCGGVVLWGSHRIVELQCEGAAVWGSWNMGGCSVVKLHCWGVALWGSCIVVVLRCGRVEVWGGCSMWQKERHCYIFPEVRHITFCPFGGVVQLPSTSSQGRHYAILLLASSTKDVLSVKCKVESCVIVKKKKK